MDKPCQKSIEAVTNSFNALVGRPSVSHSSCDLIRLGLKLKESKVEFLGENRAIGKNLREIALLFWVSPNHRKLLIDPNIAYLSEASSMLNDHLLLSLVAGKPL